MDINVFVEIIKIIAQILVGLSVCIPLVVELVKRTEAAVKEKNWSAIVAAVLKLMADAEGMFDEGATRKKWVMIEIKKTADMLGYNYDTEAETKVSEMIDAICIAAKEIN